MTAPLSPGPTQALPHSVSIVTESHFALDGGAMFGIIPKPLWSRTNPADASNRIAMACNCLLVEYADRRVLVDVGMGTRWQERDREIYKISGQDAGLGAALASRGLTALDIDEVILTHLHFDHAGGLSRLGEDGALQATYPRARHWVQKRNWSWAHGPSARDAGSYRPQDLEIFERAEGAPVLELVDGVAEILPGIEVIPCHGHTFGMQVVKVRTPDGIWAFVADLIPTSSHLRDPYVMGYDLQPLVTVDEKREILYHAMREDWRVVFEHDPVHAMGHVERDGRGQPRLVAG